MSRRAGIAGVVVSASSVQLGAAIGATAFPLVGPAGVVAVRQLTAAAALLIGTRPRLTGYGWRRLAPAALLGVVLVLMNVSLYSAVQRVGLGLGVTIEFLGPLAIALVATRRAVDALLGLLALAGVAVLTGAVGSARFDPLGVAFGLSAAVTWAAYILLTQRLGADLPGVLGTTVGSTVAAIITLPVLLVVLIGLPAVELPRVLLAGAACGVLSSAVPYALDLLILRVLPRALFGVLQSVHPMAAVLFGFALLGQLLTFWQVVGIATVCAVNVLAVLRSPGPPATATA